MRGRRRRDGGRILLMGIAAVLLVAVAIFAVLVGIEFSRLGGEEPVESPNNNDIPEPDKKFETAEIEIPTADLHTGLLILINEDHPYIFPENAPDVVPIVNGRESHGTSASGNPIYSYYTQNGIDKCAKMEGSTLEFFRRWADDFYKATGNSDLFVFDEDGYRTKEYQAERYSSKPLDYAESGATEHHTGRVVDLYVFTGKITGKLDDIDFAATFKWIYDNAYKYGFVHRYPESKAAITGVDFEPYHFRYVGYPHAYYMSKNGICLEEYLNKVKTCTADEPLEFRGDDGKNYMVYYFPAGEGEMTTLTVPAEYTYTVSGDNVGGFIITVEVDK